MTGNLTAEPEPEPGTNWMHEMGGSSSQVDHHDDGDGDHDDCDDGDLLDRHLLDTGHPYCCFTFL